MISSYAEAKQILLTAKCRDKGRPIARNTRLVNRPNEAIAVKYHDTDIITY